MDLTLSLIVDLTILMVLGVTIFYAVRLSTSLNNFKNQRKEFDTLINGLSQNIEQAYSVIDRLKDTSKNTGAELQETVGEAKYLLDELKLINDASDNLAHRLEKLATQGRKNCVETTRPRFDDGNYEEESAQTPSWEEHLPVKDTDQNDDGPFMIRDKEYETDVVTGVDFNRQGKKGDTTAFSSQAEKDLYEALQKNKK